jgi:Asp-tRNA(Asn)/Glu-tRNA(Gln) amidotransferase A subunit family amidase
VLLTDVAHGSASGASLPIGLQIAGKCHDDRGVLQSACPAN